MSKSYVSMEQKVCIATGKTYDTGTILMDRRLQDSMDRNTVTGYGFCPEVQEKLDEGYIVLVEADPEKSIGNTPDTVWRTGRIAYIRKEIADKAFNVTINKIAYIEPQVFNLLQNTSDDTSNGK